MDFSRKQRAYMLLVMVSFVGLNLCCFAHEGVSHHHHHHHNGDVGHSHCSHGHSHDHGRVHHHRHDEDRDTGAKPMLPEELAEEEDLKMYGFGSSYLHDHDHNHNFGGVSELSTLALWTHAMGCSLLVSMASLICLIILPLLFFQGKPSKTIVDSLAAFGAGAMLGDAFLHQLPHAFGGKHSHSHDHGEHSRDDFYNSGQAQSHSHSLEDLSVGLSVLSGIVLFLLVEKLVRYVEDHSGNAKSIWSHAHHHHHSHKKSNKVKIDDHAHDNSNSLSTDAKGGDKSETLSKQEVLDGASDGCLHDQEPIEKGSLLRKRLITDGAGNKDKPDLDAASGETIKMEGQSEGRPNSSSSNLVFGYLNLFSDGVHNFTDGMALGSAFLLHGSVGGWSRTLFLLAHELPQEVGDFGILVRSGFSVSKALFFNFLSALVALAGTALALLFGQDPGQSSLIEGFTAGGFIYIAVAGVLPEMNNGNSTVRSSVIQVMSLISGMAIALCISLVE